MLATTPSIGRSLAEYQEGARREGAGFEARLRSAYAERWTGGGLAAALGVRTELVLALQEFLAGKGLANIDRVSLSPITDPLAHDVEHNPVVSYRGVPYRTTHSMIYAKMLACMNPRVPGVFVDSPNIRLELPAPGGVQRGKYLVDFSQMDIEFRRRGRIGEDMYHDEVEAVSLLLAGERERALDFFEELLCFALARIAERRYGELAELGISVIVPRRPFPRFDKDEAEAAVAASGATGGLEAVLGRDCASPLFWITGLVRENYDLVYPYLRRDGTGRKGEAIPSREVFNYDLCAKALRADGSEGKAFEVLSGGLREWIFDAMARRLVDNGIIAELPRFGPGGSVENMEALGGYGPFLAAARLRGSDGLPLFPETAGGGLGIERFLFAILNGPAIERIEDVTMFGKNPDSAPLWLF